MQPKIVRLIIAIAAIVLPMYSGTIALAQEQPAESVSCSLPFRATVNVGPSQGTVLEGDLIFDVDMTGDLQGQLEMEDATAIPVFGQVVGRAISLIFELEPGSEDSAGSYIYGTGTTRNPILEDPQCGTVLGGTFAGPEEGDMGDWKGLCITIGDITICGILGIGV